MKKILFLLMSICIIGLFTACGSSDTKPATDDSADATVIKDSAVVYFTATGNTEKVAKTLSDIVSGTLYQIIPAEEYTDKDLDYNSDDCRANKEQNDDSSRPEISNDLSKVTEADIIYIGYPIWWGTNPRIIQTFLDKYDLTEKTVYTFCTSASSGIEESVSNLQKLYPKVNIVSGKRFDENGSKDQISEWIKNIN